MHLRAVSRAAVFSLSLVGFVSQLGAQPVTNVRLPAHARGARAAEVLADRLPDVARAYGLDPQRLATMLRTQPSLGVDLDGRLTYACDGLAVRPGARAPSNAITPSSSTAQIAAGTTVDVFQLHSLPGATRVIYLDFTGHTTTGTIWNSSFTGGATIVSAPFDLDGDATTFNDAERGAILAIWKRVAEDYAPFLVDVTTQDPGIESLRKMASTDTAYGIRVVISPTNWYNPNAGGSGYVGSFSWNSDTPTWVFTQQLANDARYIAEAASHEIGHTMGLNHDGLGGASPTEYYTGHGDWAPIMGVGYYRGLVQFSRGEYANANNLEDDFAIIATHAPIAADDHGNNLATASVLAGPTVADGGTIESRTDVDVFRFDTGNGAIALNLVAPSPSPNLLLKAELLNSAGQVLLTSAPSLVNTSFTPTLTAGSYYLRLSSLGSGDPATSYSSYGSVGNYLITGTLVPTTARQAPVAVASASSVVGTGTLSVNFSGQNSTDADGTIAAYHWNFGNGATASSMNASCLYTAPGSYNAVLTVTDNDGLTGTSTVVITVNAAANQAPVAIIASNQNTGTAPVAIAFSGASSYDPDGSIAAYLWNFGDGTTSTAVAPSKSFATAGTYTVSLRVTDNAGATATATATVSIAADPNSAVDVREYVLTTAKAASGTSAVATILVRDRLDRPVAGVTVSVQWSGLASTKVSGKTDSAGRVVLSSARTKKRGTITGVISAVTPLVGTIYDASIYTEPTSRSVAIN
ncbi:MAG: PKD domain-containing protein [Opitutaceae bacterium]|nr:PKD domain-containing protein [Opitutaceae bacterium]